MATPPLASEAKTESTADLTALQDAANQSFIDQTNIAIAQAIENGQQQVYMTTFQYCDINYLTTYFQNLGYTIVFPDYAPVNGAQPAELFGADYVAYWQHQLTYFNRLKHNPIRVGFSWAVPSK